MGDRRVGVGRTPAVFADDMVWVDGVTGLPVAAGPVMTEATGQALLAAMTEPVDYLPPTPLLNPGDLTGYLINISDTSEHAVVALSSGLKVRAYRARIYSKGITDVTIYDAASGNAIETIPFTAAGGIVLDFDSRPFWVSAVSQTLIIKQTAAIQLYGRISFTQVA